MLCGRAEPLWTSLTTGSGQGVGSGLVKREDSVRTVQSDRALLVLESEKRRDSEPRNTERSQRLERASLPPPPPEEGRPASPVHIPALESEPVLGLQGPQPLSATLLGINSAKS